MRLLLFLALLLPVWPVRAAETPNIVIILADDLGFGDISCYGAARVHTPRIDSLATGGLRFTDAHASAATCTPSRFSLLTGQYPFRQKGTGILPGDAGLIIAPGRPTLPSMLQHAGYKTAVVGKWHLGLGAGKIDWNGEIKPGPLEVGFTTSFIMAATADRVPCVYVHDRRIVGLDPKDPLTVSYQGPLDDAPTGRTNPELLRMMPSHGHDQTIVNGISRIGFMHGGKSAWWRDESMAATFTQQAVNFIEQHRHEPFFLYFAPSDIHVPRVAAPQFAGKTDMGPRGDVILQLDWETGQVLDTLRRMELTEKTLVIFSSDNGPVINDGYNDDSVKKLGSHRPAGIWRGGKYSSYEGGTRVPFIVSWPGHVTPGVSEALLCQTDLYASLAALTGQPPPGLDSRNVLPALLGHEPVARESLVEAADVLSLRVGNWKYIRPGKGPAVKPDTDTERGVVPGGMLFDLGTDPGEQTNLLDQQPEKAKELAARLDQIQQEGGTKGP